MKYKLTVAIPVFNGGLELERLLFSIDKQSFNKSKVEILISDNCSQDSSFEIAKKFGFRVLQSKQNEGADKNILKCISQASGEFVWVIGHDDIMRSGSINCVLNAIEIHRDVSSVFVNYSLLVKDEVIRERFAGFKGDVRLESKNDIIKILGIAPNFISCLVHNRELFLNCNPEKHFGSYWMQTASWLDYVMSSPMLAIGEPLIINAGNSEGGEANKSDVSLVILGNLYAVYIGFCESRQQKEIIDKIISQSLIRKLFNVRKRNIAIDKAKIEWARSLNTSISSKLKLFVLMNSPMTFIHCINILYKSSGLLRRLAWARI
jgi:glycosyltransferase involved in cell wall biosynthesis